MMWSPGSYSNSPSGASFPSLNTHQVALSTLKDRCSKQQKKLDELEREKLVLSVENDQLAKSLHDLDEENVTLRERNLKLNHQLEQDQDQILDLQRHLDSIGFECQGQRQNFFRCCQKCFGREFRQSPWLR